MKVPSLKNHFGIAALAIAGYLTAIVPSNVVQAETQRGFKCDTSSNIPTTVYHNAQGGKEEWIKWVSDHFAGSEWNPLFRCKTVSKRLEVYRSNGQLKYVTLGMQNNQQVICVASRDNGPCEGIVYTLRPGQDGIAALNNLFAWGSGQQNLAPSYEASTEIPYINLQERLN